MEVDADLYEFLKENETGMFRKGDTVIAYVHVYFFRLDDFVKIVGDHWFDEGGYDAQLFRDTICIDLNDIIEGQGHNLISYKNCFEESDIECYEKELLAMCN